MMVTNESVAARIADTIDRLSKVRNHVLAGRPEDLGIATILLDEVTCSLTLTRITVDIRDLYARLSVPPASDNQARRCEEATAAAFKREPCKGVTVNVTG